MQLPQAEELTSACSGRPAASTPWYCNLHAVALHAVRDGVLGLGIGRGGAQQDRAGVDGFGSGVGVGVLSCPHLELWEHQQWAAAQYSCQLRVPSHRPQSRTVPPAQTQTPSAAAGRHTHRGECSRVAPHSHERNKTGCFSCASPERAAATGQGWAGLCSCAKLGRSRAGTYWLGSQGPGLGTAGWLVLKGKCRGSESMFVLQLYSRLTLPHASKSLPKCKEAPFLKFE